MKKRTLVGIIVALLIVAMVPAAVAAAPNKINFTASQFTFAPPQNVTYDGTAKAATVTAIQEIASDSNGVEVKYFTKGKDPQGKDIDVAVNENKAINSGEYIVKIKAKAKGPTYKDTDNLTADSWKFTILKADPTAAMFDVKIPTDSTYDGKPRTATAKLKEAYKDKGVGAVTVEYYKDGEKVTGEVKAPGEYTVKLKVAAGDNYTEKTLTHDSWKFTISKADPTAANFEVTLPTALDYNKTDKLASAKAKAEVTGMGAITVKYYKGGQEVTETKNAGEYVVKLEVAEGDNYKAKTLTDDKWKFTVKKINPTAADFDVTLPTALVYNKTDKTATAKVKSDIVGMGDVTVKYFKGGKEVTETKNVGEYVVKLEVAEGDNYKAKLVEVTNSKFEIIKATVKMISATDSKAYDGTALTNDTITVSGDGFAAGEGADYDVTGKQVHVGETANTFTYDLKEGTLASNYDFSYEYGTLKVTSPIKAEVKINNAALKTILDEFAAKPEYTGKKLSIELRTDKTVPAAHKEAVKAKTGSKNVVFYDADLVLVVDGKDENIGDKNDTLVKVTYKFDFANKKDVQVYRVHNGKVDELTETANEDGAYVVFNKDAGTIDVYSAKYSTYAIAYNEVKATGTNTADTNDVAPWAVAMLVSVLGLAGVGLKKRAN